jgi:hypothetical protein
LSTTVEALRLRHWRLGVGQPTQVLDQFTGICSLSNVKTIT